MSNFPFLQLTSLPLSQQSSHRLTREYHHPSRETFRFRPLPPFPQRTSRSSQMVRFEIKSRTAVQVWYFFLAKMTSSTIGMLSPSSMVAPSSQRRPPSKKPSNGYPPFHHGTQLSSSATVNHWSRPSRTLTQLTCLSFICRLPRQYSPCLNQS